MSSTKTLSRARQNERKNQKEQQQSLTPYQRGGMKGGLARSMQHIGTEGTEGILSIEEAGRIGGSKVLKERGREYFSYIGRMGGLARGAAAEVEEITEKFLAGQSSEMGIPKVSPAYLKLMQQYVKATVPWRAKCKDFVADAWKVLKRSGFDTPALRPFARSIIEGCCEEIGWGERWMLASLPEELKNSTRAMAGQKGGQATALAFKAARKASNSSVLVESEEEDDEDDEEGEGGDGQDEASILLETHNKRQHPDAPTGTMTIPFEGNRTRRMISLAMDMADKTDAPGLVFTLDKGRLVSVSPSPTPA